MANSAERVLRLYARGYCHLCDDMAAALAPLRAAQAATEAYAAEASTRRCAVCGGRGACFGYGPPLVPRLAWACLEHRDQLDPASEAVLPDWMR